MASKEPNLTECQSSPLNCAAPSSSGLTRNVRATVIRQNTRRKSAHSLLKGKGSSVRGEREMLRRQSYGGPNVVMPTHSRRLARELSPEPSSLEGKSLNSRYNLRKRRHGVSSLYSGVSPYPPPTDLDTPPNPPHSFSQAAVPPQPIILAPLVIVSHQEQPHPLDQPTPEHNYSSSDLHGNQSTTYSVPVVPPPLSYSTGDSPAVSVDPSMSTHPPSRPPRRRQGVTLTSSEHLDLVEQLQTIYQTSSEQPSSAEQQRTYPHSSRVLQSSRSPCALPSHPRIPHQNFPPQFCPPTTYHQTPPSDPSPHTPQDPSVSPEVIVISDSDSEGEDTGYRGEHHGRHGEEYGHHSERDSDQNVYEMDISSGVHSSLLRLGGRREEGRRLGGRGGEGHRLGRRRDPSGHSDPLILLDEDLYSTNPSPGSLPHVPTPNRRNGSENGRQSRQSVESSGPEMPHYEPQQHPWAPTEYYVSPLRRTSRMHTTPLRRRGVVSIGLQSTSEESGTNTRHSPLMSRNRRRDHSALMRLAAMRGRGHQRHSHFSPGMMLMAMTVELGYEHLLELAELLGPGQPRGLSQQEINTMPVKVFQEAPKSSDWSDGDREKCVVCLSEYVKGEKLRSLKCGHDFHQACIDCWFQRNCTCPICRFDLQQT